ncbi:hypothetical protein PN36_34985, partial [Candidatus Thiomargarita nelsonii]
MPRILNWDVDFTRKELKTRLSQAKEAQWRFAVIWELNEQVLYGFEGGFFPLRQDTDEELIKNSEILYIFKNLRFIHAQLSANPPSVVVRPTSNDQEDRRKADAADRLVRYALRTYKLQEKIDRASLHCLLYGSGFIKSIWDAETGGILDIDDEGEMLLTGDVVLSIPSPKDIFLDPYAETWDDVRFVFQKVQMPYEEAVFRFPAAKEMLKQLKDSQKSDVVEIFEYWEKGLPQNGFLGRYALHLEDGRLLVDLKANPHRFSVGDSRPIAKLPYHLFTDIDIPGEVWGKSFVEYVSGLQDMLNRLDAVNLDNIQAHGVSRLILPEGAEISDKSITNSPWDIVKMTGSQPPHFVRAPQLMPEITGLRQQIRMGIDELSGVNESMFGQQSREQSGFSMQYATNQGNMIRRRLFNKYVLFVESIYKSFLNLVRKHWSAGRTIQVIGKEKAIEAVEIKGADIDGGFDLVVEYGASLSLDPMTRREEILS